MRHPTIMPAILIVSVLALFLFLACSSAPESPSPRAIQEEIGKLDQLLRDPVFAVRMAKAQDAAYYDALGKPVPQFISVDDSSETITKSLREERIAATLSPLYALECGVGALMRAKRGTTPFTILQQVAAWRIDNKSKFLLICFANATWKSGEPFVALKNIQDSNFRSVGMIEETEKKRYEAQLRLVAKKLIADMGDVAGGTCQMQLGKLKSLMQDSLYMLQVAAHIDSTSLETEMVSIEKNRYEEKIATNLAALYALESGITFLAKTKQQLPSALMRSIIDNSMDEEDMMLLARFANATWKASQPFKGLSRIAASTFIPFQQLSDAEAEKDYVQIRAAAESVTQNAFSGSQKH